MRRRCQAVPRGCVYEDMQLASASNEVGLKIKGVELNTKNYRVDHASWISCPGYPRIRVRGVQRCQGKASRDQFSMLKTFHKRLQRP